MRYRWDTLCQYKKRVLQKKKIKKRKKIVYNNNKNNQIDHKTCNVKIKKIKNYNKKTGGKKTKNSMGQQEK